MNIEIHSLWVGLIKDVAIGGMVLILFAVIRGYLESQALRQVYSLRDERDKLKSAHNAELRTLRKVEGTVQTLEGKLAAAKQDLEVTKSRLADAQVELTSLREGGKKDA